MPYYEVANIVTVTKTNMIDEMPCAYGTLHVASRQIQNNIPTEWEESAKPRLEGEI